MDVAYLGERDVAGNSGILKVLAPPLYSVCVYYVYVCVCVIIWSQFSEVHCLDTSRNCFAMGIHDYALYLSANFLSGDH